MPRSEHRRLVLSALATATAVLLAGLAGHAELVAYAAPVVVLALPLLGGRYAGEEQIARLATRARRAQPHRRPAADRPAHRPVAIGIARGGRLIADSLAVRPPPAPAFA